MNPIIVAIDGFSSTGKSTLAKALATKLGFVYVDTGAMYRAITLFAIQNKCIVDGKVVPERLIAALPAIELRFQFNPTLGFGEMYLNGVLVENDIRTLAVSQFVSKIAEISEVRQLLVQQQQAMGKDKGIVMDGRDIGTVVFPNAEAKIFMTASPETRAQRRFDELTQKGEQVDFEAVLHNVQERDYIDTHRDDSPLRKADDAWELDNSHISREEQLDQVLAFILQKTNQ
ncbi:MAG: cytidylate kinase [Flavobacterium sp. BFFFF2]|nr:MAG: cytidylate kinase [Flavobacterium sp. BFFFF2]